VGLGNSKEIKEQKYESYLIMAARLKRSYVRLDVIDILFEKGNGENILSKSQWLSS
jgi:hypothetical protein